MTTKWVKGSELSPEDQRHVLNAYVHRFTRDCKPIWAEEKRQNGKAYKVQFRSDLEWLRNTEFAVRKDGKLDERIKRCMSHPTWPDGKE